MTDRAGRPEVFWPLGAGRIVTSGFGERWGAWHFGTDFGRDGGSAGMPVFAPEDGRVAHAGRADGYGGPDPAGWLVIECAKRTYELGHIVRLPHIGVGSIVRAGQQVATINPDQRTNGGVAPHLHVTLWDTPRYGAGNRIDPLPVLNGAKEPEAQHMTTKPKYNEYWVESPNSERRGGVKPDLFLLHTQEGDSNADGLARWMQGGVGVSYHYAVSEDYNDHGVTVCDVVDTDFASWSCLGANRRSINLVFAGSRASWSREQWMRQSRAIDVAAYLAVEDCRKYGIPTTVIAPPYTAGRAGISDHNYVTQVLRDGTHTDVGPGFPWDYFAERVNLYAGKTKPEPPKPPAPQPPKHPPNRDEQIGHIHYQLLHSWPQLGGRTLVDAVAELLKRSGGV